MGSGHGLRTSTCHEDDKKQTNKQTKKKKFPEGEGRGEWQDGGKRLKDRGVPVVVQWLTNPTRKHEVVGLVPALAQWVRYPALP